MVNEHVHAAFRPMLAGIAPDERNARIDPKPGDVLTGPVIEIIVASVTIGTGGIEQVACDIGKFGGPYGRRNFTLDAYRRFVAPQGT